MSNFSATRPAGTARGSKETARLSPHLRFGEIGPRQIWHAVASATASGRPTAPERDAEKFISEVLWREFSYQLLHTFPYLSEKPYDFRFARMPWRRDPVGLRAWRTGRTGYPIVDAGMRQLWRTGWMHNRVRMIAASFLVKHLLIDWRDGERWFWDTLVDADPANNAFGWQWVTGSGPDAAPFFRVFNPVAQGRKFDPAGTYVRALRAGAGAASGCLRAPAVAGAGGRPCGGRRRPRRDVPRGRSCRTSRAWSGRSPPSGRRADSWRLTAIRADRTCGKRVDVHAPACEGLSRRRSAAVPRSRFDPDLLHFYLRNVASSPPVRPKQILGMLGPARTSWQHSAACRGWRQPPNPPLAEPLPSKRRRVANRGPVDKSDAERQPDLP